jgi:hypothetical protein
MSEPEPIGRSINVVVLGDVTRDHPIETEIAEAVYEAAERHGLKVMHASGPYYEDGDERDQKIADVTAERDRARDVAVALEQENARLLQALEEIRDLPRVGWQVEREWRQVARETLEEGL